MIVADHPIMRDGLRLAVQHEVDMVLVSEVSDEVQAIREFVNCKPDVTLIDLQSPLGIGRRIIRSIRKLTSTAALVVLDTFPSDEGASEITSTHPIFHVAKTASSEEVIAQLRAAAGSRSIDTHN